MFQEEKHHLLSLPQLGMQYFTEGQYTVNDDSCVRVDRSSYAARPAVIGSRVLVRLFARRLEIQNLKTQAPLRTHDRAQRPGTVVLPMNERVFNPSRETQRILGQAKAIGAATHKLCETLFERQGRVGQRKMWGIVGLVRSYGCHTAYLSSKLSRRFRSHAGWHSHTLVCLGVQLGRILIKPDCSVPDCC
jgi:hypothetical protein